MKLPIDDYAVIDLDAPVLPAREAFVDGSTYYCLASDPACLSPARKVLPQIHCILWTFFPATPIFAWQMRRTPL